MNIPEKAVHAIYEVVAKDARDRGLPLSLADQAHVRAQIRSHLEIAAPFIAAQALRDAADLFAEEEGVEVLAFAGDFTEVHAVMAVETWLRERSAVALEAEK